MPRKNPVPEREKEIGKRLRSFRHLNLIGRADLAGQLDIGEPRLASYETGNVPVPFHIAQKLDYQFCLNYEWLATGIGDPRECNVIGEETASRIPLKWPFSKVYDEIITPELLAKSKQPESAFAKVAAKVPGFDVKFLRTVGTDKKSTVKAIAAKSFGAHVDQLPPFLYWEFYRKLQSAADDFLQSHAKEISDFGSLKLNPENIALTSYPLQGKTDDVKPILPKLIERLRKATEGRGRKTELASWLGVSPQKVTDWLSERVEPSGETTLRLLHWVEQQERQK